MIDEVNYLVNELDISTKHAEEIINIYFDEYAGNSWDYMDYLRDEIRINKILDKLKQNKVTPVSAEYIIEDLLKEGC